MDRFSTTMITEIQTDEILNGCRKTIGLPVPSDSSIEDELLCGLLRRAAGILSPCSIARLRSTLLDSLRHLGESEIKLEERITGLIDQLLMYGDLLEHAEVSTEDPEAKETWVYPTPPSFIVSPGGTIFVIGIVPDQDRFLPESLARRLSYKVFTRVINPNPGEDLRQELHDQGLQELSCAVYFRAPRSQLPNDFIDDTKRRLEEQVESGMIQDLEILDSETDVGFYRKRWLKPQQQTGTFIGRRPQMYGAPLWCFVRLQDGLPDRLLDLPVGKYRWRGCDMGWHLQMAIDHCRGHPQRYRYQQTDIDVRVDFFSPLPKWVERRLLILGNSVSPNKCLVSYVMPLKEFQAQKEFLSKELWLAPQSHNTN